MGAAPIAAASGHARLAMKTFLPRIDPRTVPRSRILEQLGDRRPEVSIVVLAGSSPAPATDIEAAIASMPGSQIIRAGGSGTGLPAGATVVHRQANEPAIELVNRASAQALGRVICILRPGEAGAARLPDLAASFANDPRLGAAALGAGAACTLVARESLWTALAGLEPAFDEWEWAIHDFCQRVRSIGFAAPTGPLPCDAVSADAALFRHRAVLAPYRGAVSPSGSAADNRLSVYTAIADGYDTLKPQPAEALGRIEPVAFLDKATAETYRGHSRGWRVAALPPSDSDPHRAARFPKINAHLALPNSDYSLWVDASIGIVSPFPLTRLVDLFLQDCDICLFRHYARSSIFEEAEACQAYGLDQTDVIDAQMVRYRAEGLPDDAGLIEAPVILRRHTDAIRRLNEAWWNEIVRGSRRDQLSFNYVAWKLGLSYATFPLSLATGNGLFVKFQRQQQP
jgi:hypothetical protein